MATRSGPVLHGYVHFVKFKLYTYSIFFIYYTSTKFKKQTEKPPADHVTLLHGEPQIVLHSFQVSVHIA